MRSGDYLLSLHFVSFADEIVFDVFDDVAHEEGEDVTPDEVDVFGGML